VLDALTPRATDGRGLRQERHLGRANAAYRADDEQRPRPAASAVTRARRSARSQAARAARTRRSQVGTGFAPAKHVRRLRLSDRRHARPPAPATRQAPEHRVGRRPLEPIGGTRPQEFRVRHPYELASHNLYLTLPQKMCHVCRSLREARPPTRASARRARHRRSGSADATCR
jgi:hypothetical protein